MADQGGAQRIYRAPCPSCGAPVEFRSAQSTHAVCGFCRGAVVREGGTLKRLGKMAELFDDFSPLQLNATGRYEQQGFTLVGRLQYGYSQGRWTEWVAAFDDGQHSGVLSEDNGAYVFALPIGLQGAAPAASTLRVGTATAIGGQRYTVGSNEQVALVSGQGELPRLPPLDQLFTMVELRGEQGQVLSLDYGSDPPAAYLGRAVRLADLQLRGLRGESVKEEHGRGFNCPHCGAPVMVRLDNTQSIVCASCGSLIDISGGIGGELRHAEQDEPVRPLIPLGAVGRLRDAVWQVVGFQHRMGHEFGDQDDAFGWEEYLLYNRTQGFCFLVDASDGWSLVAPVTGAPAYVDGDSSVRYQGKTFNLESSYDAQTLYAAGEFYWRVERGQTTVNRDFTSGSGILSLEASPTEQVWSRGGKIDSRIVAAAFDLEGGKGDFERADAGPLAAVGKNVVFWLILLIVVMVILSKYGGGLGGGSGTGYYGGYGGYSSGGGGHK